jgi:hypothetical protein
LGDLLITEPYHHSIYGNQMISVYTGRREISQPFQAISLVRFGEVFGIGEGLDKSVLPIAAAGYPVRPSRALLLVIVDAASRMMPLELGKYPEHLKHRLTCRRRRIEPLLVKKQTYTLFIETLEYAKSPAKPPRHLASNVVGFAACARRAVSAWRQIL